MDLNIKATSGTKIYFFLNTKSFERSSFSLCLLTNRYFHFLNFSDKKYTHLPSSKFKQLITTTQHTHSKTKISDTPFCLLGMIIFFEINPWMIFISPGDLYFQMVFNWLYFIFNLILRIFWYHHLMLSSFFDFSKNLESKVISFIHNSR